MTDAPAQRCATCRSPIGQHQRHFRCSVSSCNSGRLKLVFCTAACFDGHIPTARHKKAAAIEVPGAGS